MTAYWLAQGVGVIAFLIGITTFFNRDERRFKKQLSVYSAVIGVHFFLLGTFIHIGFVKPELIFIKHYYHII